MGENNKQLEMKKNKEGKKLLIIIGCIMVGSVVLFLFIITLPFLWWLWLLILGFVILGVGINK